MVLTSFCLVKLLGCDTARELPEVRYLGFSDSGSWKRCKWLHIELSAVEQVPIDLTTDIVV